MNLKKTALIIATMGFCTIVFSANQSLSLPQALRYAERFHPKIKIQQSKFYTQQANVLAARANALPHVDLSGAYSKGLSGASAGLHLPAISNSAFRNGYGVSLDLEQTLYDFGKTKAQVGAASAGLQTLRWQEKVALADILKQTADSYHECQRAKNYVVLYEQALRNIEPLTKEINEFVRTGQRSEVDLYLTKIFRQQIEDSLLSAKQYEQTAMIQFNFAIGAGASQQYTCQPNGHPQTLPAISSLVYYLETAKSLRPEIHMIQSSKKQQQFNIKAAKADYLPRLTGLASVGNIQDVNVQEIPNRNYLVALGIKIPLFDGYATKAQVNKAIAKTQTLAYQEVLINQQVSAEVQEAWIEYNRSKQLFLQARERRKLSNKALDLAQRRYLAKNGLLVEWEEAFRTWMVSEINYWDLGFAQQKAMTQLHYSTGQFKNKKVATLEMTK